MNVEIMQWDLRLSDVVKFKSIIYRAQLHGQLNPPPALPFTCVVLFGPTDIRSINYIKLQSKTVRIKRKNNQLTVPVDAP
jgi:hypothetical protein